MINEQKIIYMETEGWGVISRYASITDTEDPITLNGNTVYRFNFDGSSDWLDSNGNFAYVGSTFIVKRIFGTTRGRYMCIGEDTDLGVFYFVLISGTEQILDSSDLIRLEDNFKLCTRVPNWVTGEDSLKRWLPVVADIGATLSTAIKPEGGFSPTSGLTISCVHDLQYTSYTKGDAVYPRLETVLSQDPENNYASVEDEGNFLLKAVADQLETIITVDAIAGTNLDSLIANTSDNYVEMPFLNSEPIVILARSGNNYTVERAINDSIAQTHPIGTVVFKRLPTFLGANTRIYETNSINFTGFTSLYFGLIENLIFTERLTGFDIEISTNLFTPRVALLQKNTSSSVTKIEKEFIEDGDYRFFPEELAQFPDLPTNPLITSRGQFYGRFQALQNSPIDVFSWVKVGNVALKVTKTNTPFEDNLESSLSLEELRAYGYDAEDLNQYITNQRITGQTYVNYFAPPLLELRDRRNGEITYIYNLLTEDWEGANLLQLDNIQQDVISEVDEALFAVRSFSPAITTSAQYTAIADYLKKEKVTLIHVFDKAGEAGSDVDDLLGGVYGLPFAENVKGLYNRVHVIDIILQVLTSTGGNNSNGLFDVLPSQISLGIKEDLIDFNTFFNFSRRSSNRGFTLSNCYIEVEKQGPAEFLQELLENNFLALSQGYDGRLRLVDLTALQVDPANPAIDYTDYVIATGGLQGFDIDLSYEAINVANTVGFTWKEPWRFPPSKNRNITVEVSPNGTLLATGQVQSNITNIYDRLKARPINFDLKYAPTGNISTRPGFPVDTYPVNPSPPIIERGGKYLALYKKPVPIITISLAITDNLPPIQTGNLFRLTGLELVGVGGNVLGATDFITCFITDVQYDYLGKVCTVKAYILSFINPPSTSRWHIAGKINEVIFAVPDYELFINGTFGVANNNLIYPPLDIASFERDIQQFSVGDTLVLLDENWVEKATFAVDSIDYDNDQIVSDDPALSAAVAGDIVMANLVSSINSIYAESLIGVNSLRINR